MDGGRASKQVVRKLVGDIDYFADAIKEDAKSMLKEAEDLHHQWNDPQYQTFLNFMRDLTDSLISDTTSLYDCARKIEERELKEI